MTQLLADIPGTIVVNRAYRVALDPTVAQTEALSRHTGAARAAYNFHHAAKLAAHRQWNQAMAEQTYACDDSGHWAVADPAEAEKLARKTVKVPSPTYMTSIKNFKADQRYDWYPEVNLYALTSGMQRADAAWRNWWDSLSGKRGGKASGYPRFARKGRSTDSFTLFHDKKKPSLRPDGYRRLKLPGKCGGSIRLKGNLRHLARAIGKDNAVICSVTISRGGKHWWASILVEERMPVAAPTKRQRTGGTVGVDWGVSRFATLSDGTIIDNPRHLQRAAKRLRKAQQALSRAGWYRASDGKLLHNVKNRVPRTPTAGRLRAQQKVSRIHAEVAAARAGFIHQVTKELATGYETVAIEDLNVRGMTAKPEPVADESTGAYQRNGARSKAGLSKSVLDAAPGEFRRQLEYKTSWYGSSLSTVDRFFPSSKTCSGCGVVKPKLRLSERTYACTECGLVMDRDHNAARNIQQAACDAREAPGDQIAGPKSGSSGSGKRRLREAEPLQRRRIPLMSEDRARARPPGRGNPVAFHA